jgi:hypothetical protein
MSKIPGYEGLAFPLSSPIEELTVLLPTIIMSLASGTVRVLFTWLAQFLVVEILLKNLLL